MGTPGPIPSPRTMLGPLTTSWKPPAICEYPMAGCDTATGCTTLWQGQSCNPERKAHDWTDCWPPRTSGAAFPGVMMGWGLYSPAYQCPDGYTTAASAVEGGNQGWSVQFSMEKGETALACCPSGYTISSIVATSTTGQTCMAVATSSTFSTVKCVDGILKDYGELKVPGPNVASTYTVFAPLFQLNYRAQDLSAASQTDATGPAATLSTPTTGGPASTSGSSSDGSSSTGTSNLSTGTKVGIGLGALFAVVLLGLLLFLMRRTLKRRRESRVVGEMLPDEKKPIPFEPELGGIEVKELEATSQPQELPVYGREATGKDETAGAGAGAGAVGGGGKEDNVFELEGSSVVEPERRGQQPSL